MTGCKIGFIKTFSKFKMFLKKYSIFIFVIQLPNIHLHLIDSHHIFGSLYFWVERLPLARHVKINISGAAVNLQYEYFKDDLTDVISKYHTAPQSHSSNSSNINADDLMSGRTSGGVSSTGVHGRRGEQDDGGGEGGRPHLPCHPHRHLQGRRRS